MSSSSRGLEFPMGLAAGSGKMEALLRWQRDPMTRSLVAQPLQASVFSSAKRSHASLPTLGDLPQPPSWPSAPPLLVPSPLRARLRAGHPGLFHLW